MGMTISAIIFIYAIWVWRLDIFYSGRYFWDQNCDLERFLTALLQPFMEIFGNSMTAHFWHFKKQRLGTKPILLELKSWKKPFRLIGGNKFADILTSAWVDTNPNQQTAIVRPKTYKGDWKLVSFTDQTGVFEVEKCSHIGAVKVVVDGNGSIMAIDQNNNWIELELVNYCKAWQNTHILMI